jgi:hypothetical protein
MEQPHLTVWFFSSYKVSKIEKEENPLFFLTCFSKNKGISFGISSYINLESSSGVLTIIFIPFFFAFKI